MIVVLKQNPNRDQLESLIAWLQEKGIIIHTSIGEAHTILGLVGDTSKLDIDLIAALDIVDDVKRVQEPYKNANRKFHPEDTVVKVGDTQIGGGNLTIMAGPCSVESEEQIVAVAQCYMDLGYSGTALDRDPKDIMNVRGTLKQSAGWNNKMFVRAEACKHQIQITDIRIERLQDISEEDCMKEGIYRDYADTEFPPREFYDYDGNNGNGFNTPRAAFASLINKVSGRGTWDRNPFVWRIVENTVKVTR